MSQDAYEQSKPSYNRSPVATLPPHVRALFWEGLSEEPDSERHADYIALRVLECGDEGAVRWVLDRYGLERVRLVVRSGRLRSRQREFWTGVLSGA